MCSKTWVRVFSLARLMGVFRTDPKWSTVSCRRRVSHAGPPLAHLLLNIRSARIEAGAEGLGSELDSGLLSEMICIPI